jgi:hypothetical protein
VIAGALAVVRWGEDYHLFILERWPLRSPAWVKLHITGMGK